MSPQFKNPKTLARRVSDWGGMCLSGPDCLLGRGGTTTYQSTRTKKTNRPAMIHSTPVIDPLPRVFKDLNPNQPRPPEAQATWLLTNHLPEHSSASGGRPPTHPDVKVHVHRQQRLDVPLVPVGVALQAGQQDSYSPFVAVRPVQRVRAVLGPAHLPAVAAQDSHVCGSDGEEPALCHRLHRAVQQVCWGAVGVQVNRIIGLLSGRGFVFGREVRRWTDGQVGR